MFLVKGWSGKWLLVMSLLALCLILNLGRPAEAAEILIENNGPEEQAGAAEQIKADGTTVAKEAAPAVTVTVKVYGRHNLLSAEQVTLGKGELTLPDGQVYRYERPTALAALALALAQKEISWSIRSFEEGWEIIQLAGEPGPWDWFLAAGPGQGQNEFPAKSLSAVFLSGGETLVVYPREMAGRLPVDLTPEKTGVTGTGFPPLGMSQAEASPATIYVPDDYSTIQAAVYAASPGDTIIVRDGTYTENVDVNKDHLTIKSENGAKVTIVQAANPHDHVFEVTADYVNISGFTVQGATEIYRGGIFLGDASNCDISSNELSNNPYGIYLDNASSCSIFANVFFDNGQGINLNNSSNNNLTGNIISNNGQGAQLWQSSGNTLADNNFSCNGEGILIYFSSGNTLTGNDISDNNSLGLFFNHCSNHVLTNNTMSGNNCNLNIDLCEPFTIDTTNKVNGKSIQYLVNKKDLVIDSSWEIGYLGIVNCTNITVKNLTLPSNNGQGVLLSRTSNSRIENVKASNNGYGISLEWSSGNILANNDISNNGFGIHLLYSSHNTLTNNNASNNGEGIYLGGGSNYNQVTTNTANSNGDHGIFLLFSSNNELLSNTVNLNRYGICLYYDRTYGNALTNNTVNSNSKYGLYFVAEAHDNNATNNAVSNNDYGIYIENSSENIIYLNNFTNRVNAYSENSTNTWSSPEEITYAYNVNTYTNYLGNYWSDYTGSDADGDGIGDTPYSIDSDKDNYPLMERFDNYIAPPTNQPPTASFTYTTEGLRAKFTSTSIDPEGGHLAYSWDFGDGASSTEQNPVHYYDLAGKYLVTLKVIDDHNLSAVTTQEITIESLLLSVTYPDIIGQGPLKIRVITAQETSITLNLGDFTQTEQGQTVEFNIDTTGFAPGRYDLTIKVKEEKYEGEVNIYDPLAYQKVINMLNELENLTEKEMQEISKLTSRLIADTLIDLGKDFALGEAADKLVETGNDKLRKFRLCLQEAGLVDEDEKAFDGMVNTIIYYTLKDITNEIVSIAPEDISQWPNEKLAEYIIAPVVYESLCQNKQNLIQARTEGAISGLHNRIFTPEEITFLQNTLTKGKRAIQNTSQERIYRLHLGTLPVINKDVTVQPDLPYFKEAHQQVLNPGGWWEVGKYNPLWVMDMTLADLQSILTIPAELNWIETTPDKEFRAQSALIPVLVKAASAYVKYVDILDKTSPVMINTGTGVSTDLLAKAVDYKHDKILQTALNGQKREGLNFTGPETKQPFICQTEQVTVTVAPEKSHYQVGETAKLNISITNQSNEILEDALWWLIVPEENLVVKDAVYLAPASTVSQTYEFTVKNPGLHLGQAYLTVLTYLAAQNYTTFTVGEGSQKGALLKADYQPEYGPGEVSVEVTVQNIGQETLNLVLLYNGNAVQLPELPAGESTKHTLTLSCPEPGTYTVPLAVKEKGVEDALLNGQLVTFKIKPIDTLSAFCACDKPVYTAGEEVHTTVIIKNAAGEEVSFPYILEIKTPSGQIINQPDFIADQPGTYLIQATPDLSGYENISAETFFLVERQSDLKLQALPVPEGIEITVKTDAGGPVPGAKVMLGKQSEFTGLDGKVKFIRPLTAEVFVRAEKTGFNPAQEMLRLADLEKASISGQARCEGRTDQNGIVITLEGAGTVYTVTTASDGLFVFTGLEPGAYLLTANCPGFLKAGRTVTATVYEAADAGELLLLAGDISGDNVVDIDDLLFLGQTYGTIQGEIGFNPVADFNADNRISLVELVLLTKNYTTEGYK